MRPGRHPRRVFGLTVAVVLSVARPSPAAAADPIELPGDSIAAVVVDLDGDGEREVVRLVRSSSDGVEVDAWHHGPRGWDTIRGTDLRSDPERGAGGLLRARHGESDRLMAVTAEPIPGDEFGAVCCVSLHEVRQEDGVLTLAPVAADDLDRGAIYIQSLDLDADGTDELVTTRTTLDDQGTPEASFFEVQAWRDGRYVQVGELATDGYDFLVYGETDGVDGAELLIGPNEQGTIRRIAFVDGELRTDEGHVEVPEMDGEFVSMSAIAGELIVIVERTSVRTLSWPAGQDPRDVGVLEGLGEYPWLTAVGTGSDALLVHIRSFGLRGDEERGATVYDLDLREVGEVSLSPTSDAIVRLIERGIESAGFDVFPYPYVGPLPPELVGDRPSLAGGGVLIAQDGEGGIETRPMSPLAGLHPHGVAGPDAAWLAASSGLWYAPPDAVSLNAGVVSSLPAGRVVLIPAENLWGPLASEAASVELVGAAFGGDGEHLLSSPDGFAAVLDAPPGTLVFTNGIRSEALEVGSVPLTVEFAHPRGDGESNSDFEYGLLAIMPDGRALVEEWKGTVVREAPSLEATSATTTFELGARITGSVSPYAELMVYGHTVEVNADGAFEVAVDAPPWPIDVVVVARDPLGNETSASVQVIGVVDYRGLPWLPIIGLLTALVGAYALLRVPRPRARPAPAWADDSTLEEIELE